MTTISQENLLGYVKGNKLGHDNSQMSNTFLGYYKDNWYGHDFIQRLIIVYTYSSFDAYPLRNIIRDELMEEGVDVMMMSGQKRTGTLNGTVVSEEYLAGGEGYSMGGQYGDGEVFIAVQSTDGTDVVDYVVKTREEIGYDNWYTYRDAFYGGMTDEIWNTMQGWFLPTTYEYIAFNTSSIRSAYDTWASTNLNTQQIVLSNERGIKQEAYAGGQLVGSKYLYVANTSGPTGSGLLIIESNDGTTIAEGNGSWIGTYKRIAFASEYVSGVSSLRTETDLEVLFTGGKGMIPKTGVLNYGDLYGESNTYQAYISDTSYGGTGVIVDWQRYIIRSHKGHDANNAYSYNSSPIYSSEFSSYGITFTEWEKTIKLLSVGGCCMFKTSDVMFSGDTEAYDHIPDFPAYSGGVTNYVGWVRRNSSYEYDILDYAGNTTHIYHSGALGSGTLSVDSLMGEYLYQNIVRGQNLDAQLQTDNAGIQPGPDAVVHFFRTGALPQVQSSTYYQDIETKTYNAGSGATGTISWDKANQLITVTVSGRGSITMKDRNVGASYPLYRGTEWNVGAVSEQPPAGFHQISYSELNSLVIDLLRVGIGTSVSRFKKLLLLPDNCKSFLTTLDSSTNYYYYWKPESEGLTRLNPGSTSKSTTRWVKDT